MMISSGQKRALINYDLKEYCTVWETEELYKLKHEVSIMWELDVRNHLQIDAVEPMIHMSR